MKKNLLFAAIALTALAGCSDNSFVGDESPQGSLTGDGAISFNYQFQNATRGESDHATSAANLGNQFIVWGEKSSGASDTKDAPAAGHIVFPNYQVNYAANTAYNTTSNTKDWEYVGYTHSTNYQSNIKYKASGSDAVSGSSAAQTIKYWDYAAGSYTFTAVAAKNVAEPAAHDLENGYIKIQKNIDDNDKASEKGYTITVTANADLQKLYLSDRTVITQGTGTDRNATNAYGGNVTLKFRNALSQIRAGVYETIPGYAISDIKFYVNTSGETPTQTQLAQVESIDAFGALCPNIKGSGYAGDLTVTYSEETATLNQPVVSASGTVNTNLILGTNINAVTTAAPLGTSSTSPTWDTSEGTYTTVLLQGAHTTNLKLKCDYTLYNSVSGETIEITGATAEVPYEYLQWKPNFKYSYLFKITDAKLYPITFDAIEITNGDGLAEYITIVNEPSITTFGVIVDSESKFKNYVTGNSDYQAPTGTDKLDIYAAIEDNHTLVTPVLSGGTQNVKIYLVDYKAGATSAEKEAFPITESSLAEAIAETGAGTEIITYTDITNDGTTNFSAVPSAVTTVPGEDGVNITGTHAVKLTGIKGTANTTKYYAIEYVTGKWNNDGGKTYADASAFSAAGTLYTDTDCTTTAESWTDGTTYYKRTTTKNVYKIIKVVIPSAS